MGKKYEKPEIKDLVPPFLHGQISPMGLCSLGKGAAGEGACDVGENVFETGDHDCSEGFRPAGYCTDGLDPSICKTGTNA